MVTVRYKTGKVRQVTRNVAHDLIERGEATMVEPTPKKKPQEYNTRQVHAKTTK